MALANPWTTAVVVDSGTLALAKMSGVPLEHCLSLLEAEDQRKTW